MSVAAMAARIPQFLDFANLSNKRDAKVPTLSGGIKRRLTLLRAGEPKKAVVHELHETARANSNTCHC
jgi:ABC-type nitrate/sulfonate/bicarbonate transport system ATPase subunit